MAAPSLEERVTALEAELEQMKRQQESLEPTQSRPWWEKIVGIYKDDPEFEEAVRLGREWRMADAPNDDEDLP